MPVDSLRGLPVFLSISTLQRLYSKESGILLYLVYRIERWTVSCHSGVHTPRVVLCTL